MSSAAVRQPDAKHVNNLLGGGFGGARKRRRYGITSRGLRGRLLDRLDLDLDVDPLTHQ
jgi:hypothetical protein